jgi:hypothetical protein
VGIKLNVDWEKLIYFLLNDTNNVFKKLTK